MTAKRTEVSLEVSRKAARLESLSNPLPFSHSTVNGQSLVGSMGPQEQRGHRARFVYGVRLKSTSSPEAEDREVLIKGIIFQRINTLRYCSWP